MCGGQRMDEVSTPMRERKSKTNYLLPVALVLILILALVWGLAGWLLLPLMFVQLLQSPEDYYNRVASGTFMRWIRYMGLLIATTFPSLYVAVTSYHPEMLPLNLLLSIAAAREGVPFPAFVEALIQGE